MNKTSEIPKTAHFIWLGPKAFPGCGLEMIDRFVEIHPGWQVETWDETRILDTIAGHPNLKSLWDKYVEDLHMRVMVGKLTALWVMGGVALDIDVFMMRSMDHVLKTKKDNFFATDQQGRAEACVMASVPEHSLIRLAIKLGNEKVVKDPKTWLYMLRDTWPRPRFNVVPEHYFSPIRVRSEVMEFLRKWPKDQLIDLEKRRKRYTDDQMPYGVHCKGSDFSMPPLFNFPYPNEATAYPEGTYEIVETETPADELTETTLIDDGKKAGWFRKLVNVTGAAGRAVKAVVKKEKLTVSSEEVARRLNVCRTSGEGGKPCHYLNGASCSKCGCVLAFKQKLATESCPIGRW